MPENEVIQFVAAIVKFLDDWFCLEPGIQVAFEPPYLGRRKYKQQTVKHSGEAGDFTDQNYGIDNDFNKKSIFLCANKYADKFGDVQRKKEKEKRKNGPANQQQTEHNIVVVKMICYLDIFV